MHDASTEFILSKHSKSTVNHKIIMTFELKRNVIFAFIMAVPFWAIATPTVTSPLYQDGGVIWSNNATKVRMLKEFQAARRQLIVRGDNKDEEMDVCTSYSPDVEIPLSFDARQYWRYCPSLWEIRNQGVCNSWAVAAASVLSDRICIATNGSVQWRASDQDLLDSLAFEKMGSINSACSSYVPILSVWEYLRSNGTVSGGYYNSRMGCRPTSVPPCQPESGISCSVPSDYRVKFGEKRCDVSSMFNLPYSNDTRKIFSACQVQNATAIQAEILKNGPVLAVMHHYPDLYQHSTNDVYKNMEKETTNHIIHPVKIVGWVTGENDERKRYWIVANSWGYTWGDGGFFRLEMNESQSKVGAWIMEQVSCPKPKVIQ